MIHHYLLKIKTLTLLILVVFLTNTVLFAQLETGDLAIIGFNSDTSPDQLAIVALADIPSGQTIYISDLEWTGTSWDAASTTDGAITWTTTSIVPAGTILNITINNVAIAGDLSSYGTVSKTNWTSTSSSVTSGGDAWFIYQGTAPTAIPTNWVFGWNNWSTGTHGAHAWVTSGTTSSTTSYLPADLTNGTNAIALSSTVPNGGSHRDNMRYTGVISGDKATILAEIVNIANWTGDETVTEDLSAGGTNFPTSFSVSSPNSAPTATAPAAPTISEDATNVALADDIDVADSDGDDQTVTFTITGGTVTLGTAGISFGGSGNGSASFTAQGTLANINAALDAATFTPTADLNGTNVGVISFISNDGTDDSNTASVTFDITAVNDEPSFTKGADEDINEDAGAQTSNGWASAINKGATNESGQTLTFTVTNDNNALFSAQPAIDTSGNLTYTPATDANGSATMSIVLSDDGGTANGGDDTFATQTFTITVNAVNDEPSFTKGADEDINEDAGAQTSNGWATAIDKGATNESGQTLTFTVTNDNNALFSAQPAIDTSGNLTYTPATDANGSATVSIVLSDDGGTANGGDDTFATQTFTITVNAVNDEPSFTKGADEDINEDAGTQTANGWATAIDKGATNESGQTLTFTVTNDNNALFSAQPAIDASGNLTYTPAADANGSATVSVVLSDNGGTANGGDDTFATQNFTITVNAVNDEPSFTAGANETVNEDAGAQTTNGWATALDKGATDESGQTLTFTVTNDNNALFSAQPAIDASGNLTYTPAADANGSATVSVVLSDNGGTANGGDDTFATQNFTITVNAVNDEPSFTAGANETVNEDAGAQTTNGWATAIDKGATNESGQTLTFTVTNDNNALFSAQPAIDALGNLTYTPAADANGSATVSVVLSDDGGTANGGDDTFATQNFTITVNAVNDEPSFTAGANETVNEDAGAQTTNGWATAIDKGATNESGQTLTFTVTNDNNALFSTQPAIDTSGSLTYTPATDANGSATVSIALSDDGGTANGGDDTFVTQTFTITVNAVNDEPSFTKGADEDINEDAGAQTANGWATAIDKGATNESGQTLTFTVTNDNNALFSTQPAIDDSGNLTYTPATDANGSATVSIVLSDDGGTANGGDDTFATQTFTITVNAVNDEPSFTKGADEDINEDAGAQTTNGWATALDKGATNESGQTLTFTVTNDNNALFSTQPAIDASGSLTYTPAADANGSATVSVVLSDDGGTTNGGDDTFATQNFTITVNAVNDEPSFTAGANETVNEDAGAQTVNGWATALDKGATDENGQTLTFTVTNDNNALFSAQPAIDASGNLTYTPASDANGSATVSIVLSDDGGTANGGDDTFATQTFTITVNAVNDEPSFTPGANEMVNENTGIQTVNGWATSLSTGPADESGQTLTFTVTNDNNGLFSAQPAIDASGNLTYTPATDASGSATVSVVLSDDGGTANGGDDTFAAQTFTIEVASVLGVQDEIFSGLTVYPIPAKDILTISNGTNVRLTRAEVFNIQGKLINSKELNSSSNNNTLDVSNIPTGLYLLKIYSENNYITKRVSIK